MACQPDDRQHPSMDALRCLEPVVRSPMIRAFVGHLLRIHPRHRLPLRREFDPIDVPRLLSNLALVRVFHDPIGFEYRVVGDRIRQAVGEPMVGQRLERLAAGSDAANGPIGDRITSVNTEMPI